jgi:hypothetical protein
MKARYTAAVVLSSFVLIASASAELIATPVDSGRVFADAGVAVSTVANQFWAGDNTTTVSNRQNRGIVVFELPTLTPDFTLTDVKFEAYFYGIATQNVVGVERTLVPLDLVFIDHGTSNAMGTADFNAGALATKTGVANKDSSIDSWITWSGDSNLTSAVQAAIDDNDTHVAFRFQLQLLAPYVDGSNNPTGDGGVNNDQYSFCPHNFATESLRPTLTLIPEPGTLVLLGAGMTSLFAFRRRLARDKA